MNNSIYLLSLGCDKNKVDGEVMLGQLLTDGFSYAQEAEMAAIINRVLNRLLQGTEDLLPNRLIWFDNKDPISWYYIHIQEATNSHRYRMKDDDIHEQWIELTPNRDWTILEKPYSQPEDILK